MKEYIGTSSSENILPLSGTSDITDEALEQGIDLANEKICRSLARAAALRWKREHDVRAPIVFHFLESRQK